jgi:two-component system chemotaxis response regulator CheY
MPSLENINKNIPILVVDDFSSMRRIVGNCLRQLGFENITEAENADSAVELAHSGEFKFVISDWSLPEINGADLLNALRQQITTKEAPLLVIATEKERAQITPLQESKVASAVIVKPFTTAILQKKMEEALEGYGDVTP